MTTMDRDKLIAIDDLVNGATVSVDVSTGDHDAGARVFGRICGVQEDDGSLMLLAELVEDNRIAGARERLARHMYVKNHSSDEWGPADPEGFDESAERDLWLAEADKILAIIAGTEK